MSQTEAIPQKLIRRRWRWIGLGLLICASILACLLFVRSERVHRDLLQEVAKSKPPIAVPQMASATQAKADSARGLPAAAVTLRKHIVHLQCNFEAFETRSAYALVVERLDGTSFLITPFDCVSATGMLNGRLVTRQPTELLTTHYRYRSENSRIAFANPATPFSDVLIKEDSASGLAVLGIKSPLPPIRFLGEFPKAAVGDKLIGIDAPTTVDPEKSGANNKIELAVLGVDESVTTSSGRKLEHLLKLTAWTGDVGALICNKQGDPVGQIVCTTADQGVTTHSYAVPMDRVFAAYYDKQTASPVDQGDLVTIHLPPAQDWKLLDEMPVALDPIPAAGGATLPITPSSDASGLPPHLPGGEAAAVNPFGTVPNVSLTDKAAENPVVPTVNDPPTGNPVPETTEAALTRIYPLQSNPSASQTITQLFESNAGVRIAYDDGSQSLIVIAPNSIQAQIADMILNLNRLAEVQQKAEGQQVATGDEKQKRPSTAKPSDVTSEITATVPQSIGDERDVALDREARDLARQIRTAPPAEQGALKQKLGQLTERHFQYRQEHRRQELDELSSRIDKLRTTYTRRQENKAEVIQRRLNELLDPNTDLEWESSSSGGSIPVTQSRGAAQPPQVGFWPAKPLAGEMKLVEPTFDGIPYSQWLQILATERKPAKLISALEACGQLADPKDARVIARKVFLAARLFEAPDAIYPVEHQFGVWNAAMAALNRLPPDAVVDELLVALRDQQSFKTGREFQGQFAAGSVSTPIQQSLAARCDEVIGQFIENASENDRGSGWALAGACAVWAMTERPLSDFEKLRVVVLDVIDNGIKNGTKNPPGRGFGPAWQRIVSAVVARAPETPNLALSLMNHASQGYFMLDSILSWLGKMGRHAEPAVPIIVDQIVAEFKNYEDVIRMKGKAGEVNERLRRDPDFLQKTFLRIVQRIQTLGQIGVGATGYALLRQLRLIVPVRRERDPFSEGVFTAVEHALKRFKPAPESESVPFQLSDFWLLHGQWRLRLLAPGNTPKEYVTTVYHNSISWLADENRSGVVGALPTSVLSNVIGNGFNVAMNRFSVVYEIDESKIPKQIELQLASGTGSETRRLGVYEVTERTLRIQLAAVGKPAPTEIVKGRDELPEGNALMEFDREMPETLEAERDQQSSSQSAIGSEPANTPSDVSLSDKSTGKPLKAGGQTQDADTEPTFDGIPYSQWLKILATERKSAKLITALEACGQLAEPKDASYIARKIFLAARWFELPSGTVVLPPEQYQVWSKAREALHRLPADVVVDELLAALRDQESFKSGREFQGKFVAGSQFSNQPHPPQFQHALVAHSDELISRFVAIAAQRNRSSGWALAGAVTVWEMTDRPLGDFEKLSTMALDAVENGIVMDPAIPNWKYDAAWERVVNAVVARAPETPDLALKLMKNAAQVSGVVIPVGKLGRHAEAAVPLLVDQFLAEWKQFEDHVRGREKGSERSPRPQGFQGFLFGANLNPNEPSAVRIVQAIGRIGVGAKGYALLRQLSQIAPSPEERKRFEIDTAVFSAVDEALKSFHPDPEADSVPYLLGDFWLLHGRWKLRLLAPLETPENHVVTVENHSITWDGEYEPGKMQPVHSLMFSIAENGSVANGLYSTSFRYTIDESQTPKRITFLVDRGGRREGVYELTNTSLRIQLAPKGEPAPKAIAKGRDDLPEGHILMEFDRQMTGTPNPEDSKE